MADPITLGLAGATALGSASAGAGAGTIASIGMGATAAGGALKAFGDIFTGEAKSKQLSYQAAVAEMDATLKRQDAQYAVASGEVEAQQIGYRTADVVARSKVGFAAGNIAPTSGTAGRVISSELSIGDHDVAVSKANTLKRAYGFDVAAAEDDAQASLYRVGASTAKTAGYINAGATILGTVGSLSNQYLAGSRQGSGVLSSKAYSDT